jgi:hypothetical protein
MSWAAGRQTTRVEDEAYCLLGIFSVNMPLLYGEGRQAFVRLQQEIIKASEDQTILAWGYNRAIRYDNPLAVFARSPAHFRFCGNLYKGGSIFQAPDIDRDTLKAFEMTNIGLRITLTLLQIREGRGKMYAILPTARRSGSLICMPVIWRQRYNERIEDMPDEAVIERCTQQQPLAVPIASFAWQWKSVARKTVVLRSVYRPISFYSREELHDVPQFTVVLKYDGWSRALEVWNPHLEFDQTARKEIFRLSLRGFSEHHRLNPWPLFIRVCGVSLDDDARTTTEYLIAVSFTVDPPKCGLDQDFPLGLGSKTGG